LDAENRSEDRDASDPPIWRAVLRTPLGLVEEGMAGVVAVGLGSTAA
jgi:hypothetical protein